jgi:Ala-tRNA(Pro) deacylase
VTALNVFEAIKRYLDENNIAYRAAHHEPTYTSEEAARARGEDMKIGGKALVMKIGEDFRLFVLSGALKLNSSAIKEHFQEKRTRFATAEELKALTGCVPGCVPPFGEPILPLPLYVDNSILANQKIAFNAGSLTDSIIMDVIDYVRIAKPIVFNFSVNE